MVDGVTVAQWQRLQWLSRGGHGVLLLCPDYRSLEKIYPNWQEFTGKILPGVKVVNLPSTSYLGIEFERNVSSAAYAIALQELSAFQPDLIHVDEAERLSNGFLRIPGVKFAAQQGIPCVSFFHTNFVEYAEDFLPLPKPLLRGLQWLLKRWFSHVYNAYSVTLVSSRDALQKVQRMGIRNAKLGEFLGVDTAQFHPKLRSASFFSTRSLPHLEHQVKLVFLGRLTPDKGWKFALRALTALSREIDLTQVAILIAGDGEMQAEIAAALGKLTPHLYMLGRISPDQVPVLLANCDIHITTSEKETRGLTILEAFACGIPAIAPRAGGIQDSLEDGVNGLFYEPGNIADFVQKVRLLIEHPGQRQQMGSQARSGIAEQTWDRATENLVAVWQQQIAQGKNQCM